MNQVGPLLETSNAEVRQTHQHTLFFVAALLLSPRAGMIPCHPALLGPDPFLLLRAPQLTYLEEVELALSQLGDFAAEEDLYTLYEIRVRLLLCYT